MYNDNISMYLICILFNPAILLHFTTPNMRFSNHKMHNKRFQDVIFVSAKMPIATLLTTVQERS